MKKLINWIVYRLFGATVYREQKAWVPELKVHTVTPDEYGDFNILSQAILDHKIENGHFSNAQLLEIAEKLNT